MAALIRALSRFGLFLAATMFVLTLHVAHAQNQGGNSQGGGGNSQGGGGNHGGPGPLVGGGLPAVVLIGAGAYLAYRRSRPTKLN